MKLASLKARSVRGIPRDWTDLPIGAQGLVIFGQNGVGKSSVVDAIEYAVSGKTSLFPVRRQNVNWENGAPHVRHGASEISVKVAGSKKPFPLSADEYPDNLPEEDQAWILAARSASFVLRRHMLLSFVTRDPRDRYELLEPFMNLDAYRATENALRDLKGELETAHAAAATTMRECEGPLRRIFNLEPGQPVTGDVLLERLNAALRQLNMEEVQTREALDARSDEIAKQLGGEEQTARLATLGGLKTEIQHLGYVANLTELLDALFAAIDELEKEVEARTDAVLTDLLTRGREAIESTGLTTCPLCEQDIDSDAVLARLDERIEADARITAGRKLVAERRTAVLSHLQPLAQSMERFIEHWDKAVETPLPDQYGQTVTLLRELEAEIEREQPKIARTREFLPRLNACVGSHEPVIGILDALIATEGGGERRMLLGRADGLVKAMMTDWPAYEAAVHAANRLEQSLAISNRLHDHAVEARKSAVGAMFDDVARTANEFYEKIHPGEGVATSRLQVRDVGNGSLTLSTNFHGNEENPLLHYSESHLDTLSLCYFFALRRHEADMRPLFKMLVLDDVMHSVDADHRARIAEVLKEEFSDHQIVITTHDIHFFDALRRELGANGYHYLRINNWDLERGPVLGDPLTDFDRIMVAEEREKLGQETLAAAGGRFFEWLLKETTEALDVAIPARFKRGHDLGNLWPPLAAKLRRQKGFVAAHDGLVEALEQNSWVRNNCGAHFNDDPVPPTPEEVRAFAAMLASLYEALHCPNCRKFIGRQQNDDWRCVCGNQAYPK